MFSNQHCLLGQELWEVGKKRLEKDKSLENVLEKFEVVVTVLFP